MNDAAHVVALAVQELVDVIDPPHEQRVELAKKMSGAVLAAVLTFAATRPPSYRIPEPSNN